VVFRCVAKGVVILFRPPLIHCLADGNRAQPARFPVRGADSASRSLRRGAPSFASRPRGCRLASELACHSRVVRSREPILSEVPLRCALFERDCKVTFSAPAPSASMEMPSLPSGIASISQNFDDSPAHRNKSSLLRSCCPAQRSLGFANRDSRDASSSSLSFLIPVSRSPVLGPTVCTIYGEGY
jgi:hypothetical protein